MINTVTLSPRAQKDLRKCPSHIVRGLMAWIGAVQVEDIRVEGIVEFALVETVSKHEY